MKIIEIIQFLEDFAPLELQEDFDNAGVQVGDVFVEVRGILLCLDVTEKVIDEAVKKKCNLIVSHHPLLFKALKTLTGKTYIERCIIKACKKDIMIYSAHTNLDNVAGGINFYLAKKIGLQNITLLRPQKGSMLKLAVFVPIEYVEVVRDALFHAGAGQMGHYDFCSFNSLGEGTFRGGEDAHPFVGKRGEFHQEKEVKIETIFPVYKKTRLLSALRSSHPYEEPAYDIFPLLNRGNIAGAGVIGDLPIEESEISFLQKIKVVFHLKSLRYSSLRGKSICKVAFCAGSGAFLIQDAVRKGADIFLTGEARYNDYHDVADKMVLAVIGHYESEHDVKAIFFDKILKKFPTLAIYLSEADSNPINYI